MRLIIKGNPSQALQAAQSRGVRLTIESGHNLTTTIGTVPAYQYKKVAGWFQEDLGRTAPYPIGSCLHYTVDPV